MQCLTDLISLLVALEWILRIQILLYYNVTFCSPSSRITQRSNSYHHVGFISLITSLREDIISSKTEHIFIRDLSDLTLQIVFDAWWAWINVGSKRLIAWSNSRHASSWRFYLHGGIEKTCSPGILCIVCHQDLCPPSEHATSSMGKHLLPNTHIPELNESTESEVTHLASSTVDETALAILKRHRSRGIKMVSWKRKFIYHIPLNPYWSKWQTKRSKLASTDYETSKFHQDTWNRYLMLGFVLAHICWNAISDLELRQWFKAWILGTVKDFEKRAMLESTRCRPWDQV